MTHEIIRSLETIQDQVKQELLNVRTYRAYLAVGQAIDEISDVEEIVRSLTGIRSQVVDRLNDVREYRALLAVQKSVLDISEVLGILEESSRKRTEAAAGNGAAPAPAEVADDSRTSTSSNGATIQSETVAVAPAPSISTAILVDHISEPAQPPQPTGETVEVASAGTAHVGDAASQSENVAFDHPPFPSTGVMADQAHELHQPPEPTHDVLETGAVETGAVETGAVETAEHNVVREGDAASETEMGSVEHPPSSSTAVMADQTHEQQPPQPTGETGENVADNEVHEGETAESEEIGIAKVA